MRVALPNKGQLAEPARKMLAEAGYLQSFSGRDLVVHDPANDAEFFLLRPRDVAIYVGEGTLDAGITGRDLLQDSGANASELLSLGFGPSTFRLATPPGLAQDVHGLAGKRIATSYPRVLQNYLATHEVSAQIVTLDGAVENAIQLGVADAIADVVDTGTTIRQAGLEIIGEPILTSEAVLISRNDAADDPVVATFVRRLHSVLTARSYALMDYDVPKRLLDQACALTPGLESPTISTLHDPEWVAVRAMVAQAQVHRVMDQLYELGARGILVSEINACRL